MARIRIVKKDSSGLYFGHKLRFRPTIGNGCRGMTVGTRVVVRSIGYGQTVAVAFFTWRGRNKQWMCAYADGGIAIRSARVRA